MRTNCSIVSKWPDSGYPCHLHVLGWTCLGMTRDRGDVKWTYKQKGGGKYMLVRPQLEGQYKRWGRSDQINYTCWPLYSHKLFLKVGTTSKWFLDIFISYINTSAKFAGKSSGTCWCLCTVSWSRNGWSAMLLIKVRDLQNKDGLPQFLCKACKFLPSDSAALR